MGTWLQLRQTVSRDRIKDDLPELTEAGGMGGPGNRGGGPPGGGAPGGGCTIAMLPLGSCVCSMSDWTGACGKGLAWGADGCVLAIADCSASLQHSDGL